MKKGTSPLANGPHEGVPNLMMHRSLKSAVVVSLARILGGVTGMLVGRNSQEPSNHHIFVKARGYAFEPSGEPVVMDQRTMTFVPKVLAVLVGTQVDFLNSDDVLHNVFSPDKAADRFNLPGPLKPRFILKSS